MRPPSRACPTSSEPVALQPNSPDFSPSYVFQPYGPEFVGGFALLPSSFITVRRYRLTRPSPRSPIPRRRCGRSWRRRAINEIPRLADRRETSRQRDSTSPGAPRAIAVEANCEAWLYDANGLRLVHHDRPPSPMAACSPPPIRPERSPLLDWFTSAGDHR